MHTSLATILLPCVRSAESGGEYVASPFDEEVSLVADAVSGRQAEFFGSRACARRAPRASCVRGSGCSHRARRSATPWVHGCLGYFERRDETGAAAY